MKMIVFHSLRIREIPIDIGKKSLNIYTFHSSSHVLTDALSEEECIILG